jgi:lipopolysaccharide export system permease protein
MRRLINRYIFKEIAGPFCMILLVLTFVLLMGKILQLMDLMINKGVSFFHILQLMIFLLPSFLMFTIPISLLIAILIGVGRLSGDNEVTILKMSGVSLAQLSIPIAWAASAAFALTVTTTILLVPYGNMASKSLLFDMAKQKASIAIREKVFIDDFRGILLYAEKIPVSGDSLENVLISDNRLLGEPSTIIARKAYLFSDPDTLAITLRLEDGSIHTLDAAFKNYRKVVFQSYDVRLDLASSIAEAKKAGMKSSTEMTVRELAAMLRTPGIQDESLREIAIELNKKLAIPVSCFVFALISLPLGIRAHRSVRSRGFAIGLALVLMYYVLRLWGEALVETGRLAPIIGTWTPNGLFLIAGIIQFHYAAHEKTPWRVPRRLSRTQNPPPASPDGSSPCAGTPAPSSDAHCSSLGKWHRRSYEKIAGLFRRACSSKTAERKRGRSS